MKILLTTLLTFLALLSARAQGERPVSLEGIIREAQQNALPRAAAERDLKTVKLDAKILGANLLPQLSGFANLPNYARTFQEVVQPNGTIAFQPIRNNNSSVGLLATQRIAATGGLFFLRSDLQRFDDFENDDFQYNGLPFRFGFQQEIFGFNPWKWDKKTQALEQSRADKKYRYDLAQISLESTRLYFDLLIARQNFSIAEANVNNNIELLKIAAKRFELGVISENDYLQLELAKVSAENSKAGAEQSVKLAEAALLNYLGRNDETALSPSIPQPEGEVKVETAAAIAAARKNRFDTDNYLLQILEAERNTEQMQRETGLNMTLNASIGYSRSAKDIKTIYNDPQNEQFLQVSLSLPIIDWGRRKAQVEQTVLAEDFTRRSVRQQELEFEQEIKNSLLRLEIVQEQLKLSAKQQEIARKRFDIAKESFVLGAISTTDLGIAQQEKDFALRDYILTLRNYWVSYYELKRNTLLEF